MENKKLTTKNLVIRDTEFDDCKYFAEWEVDPAVTKYLSYNEDRTYEEVVREWIIDKNDDSKMHLTVVRKDTGLPIGRIYISRINRECDSLDITKLYIADEENRKKGFGEELMRELLEYCYVYMHMERVTLDHYPGNNAAAHLYDKLGFQREGVARNATKKDGKYYDLHLMSMLRSEFFEKVHDR